MLKWLVLSLVVLASAAQKENKFEESQDNTGR